MKTCFVLSKAYGQKMNNSNKKGSVNDKESVMNILLYFLLNMPIQ